MKISRKIRMGAIIGLASFFMLTACDSEKSDIAEKAKEIATETSNSVEQVVADTSDKAKEVAGAASDQAKEIASDAADKANEVTAAVSDHTKELVSDVADKAEEVAVVTSDSAENVAAEVETMAAAEDSSNAAGQEYIVKMLNNGEDGMMVFEPAFLKVEKGATVKFEATDAGHDSVSAYVPDGAEGWKGDNSKDITVTLDTEGVYLYKCTPHIMMGMVGVIQVGAVTDKSGAEKASEELLAKMAMGKERLGKYLSEVK
jgi:pseudoazurin